MSTSPLLTQSEAAAACGVSRTTVRRRREASKLPGPCSTTTAAGSSLWKTCSPPASGSTPLPHPMRRKSAARRRPRHSRARSTRTRCE
ncbi:hypothetical protein ACR6C2_01310 [Streptomyces sp. INA 01156]